MARADRPAIATPHDRSAASLVPVRFGDLLGDGHLVVVQAMKRYRIDFSYGRYFFDERADGDWVRFDDHAEEVHRLNNALTAAYLERDGLKRLLEAEQQASAALRRHVDPQGD